MKRVGFVGFAATVLGLVVVPAVASAAQQQEAKAEPAKAITKAEISARLDTDYAELDADKDGKVTAAEIDSRLVKSAEAKIEAIKKERDATFAKLDANGDGNISRAEFDEKAKLPVAAKPDAKPFLDRFDANKDGAISKDEFRGPTLANFNAMDLNKDGTLTPAEAEETEKKTSSVIPARKTDYKSTPSVTR